MLHTLLVLIAVICFAFSAVQPVAGPGWNRNVSVGLAFLAASFIW